MKTWDDVKKGPHGLCLMNKAELAALEEGQREVLKGLGLKELHYMKKFEDGSRAVVVLLWDEDKGRMWRGCTACVPQDQYVKSVGRMIARGRALRAVKNDTPTGEIKRGRCEGCEAIEWIYDAFGEYKAARTAKWTAEETALVSRRDRI